MFEESDLFPVSRASSCTVVSEQERRVLSPTTSIDCETPVVKPHPFSFRTTPQSVTGSSTDSYRRHHANSEGDGSDSASYRAFRSKSNSLNYSGEYSCSTSVPTGSLKNSPLVSGAVAKHQQYSHLRNLTTHHDCTTAHTLCSCNNRDHPVASKEGDTLGYRQFQCKCHYGDPHSCACDPTTESMGLCPINNGFVTFDPNRRYNEEVAVNPGLIVFNTPPSRDSSDNVSLASDGGQSNVAVGSPPYNPTKTSGGIPYNQSPKDCYGSTNPIRTSCTSIDSGYEKSMSMSSFTDSAKESSCLGDCLPMKVAGEGLCQMQYGSAGDVSQLPGQRTSNETSVGGIHDGVETKPRAKSLCDMERREDPSSSVVTGSLGKEATSLYPKLSSVTPQLVIEDLTLTSQQASEAKATASLTSSSDGSTPVAPLSKSATPSPTSSVGNATNSTTISQSKVELKRAFFAGKGKKAKGIRTIEDSVLKQQHSSSPTATRPRSHAVSYPQESNWKTRSCDMHGTETATPPTCTLTSSSDQSYDNHVTSTPTYFGHRVEEKCDANLQLHHQQHPSHLSNLSNESWKVPRSTNRSSYSTCPLECPQELLMTQCTSQTCPNFGINPFASKFEARPFANGSPYQPVFGSPTSKSGPQASVSTAVANVPILLSDVQSIISETDSGHCTKSFDDRSQADVDTCSQISQASELSHLSSNVDNISEYSEVDNDVFGARCREINGQTSHRNQQYHPYQRDQLTGLDTFNPESSLTASYLKLHRNSPSLLQQKLREYEATVHSGGRPRMLEQFDDFTDVELPTFDDYCLDDVPSEMEVGGNVGGSHRHRMGDFGHSLFAG